MRVVSSFLFSAALSLPLALSAALPALAEGTITPADIDLIHVTDSIDDAMVQEIGRASCRERVSSPV